MGVASRMPRSSPSHLVYKFGCGVQHLKALATVLDLKTMSTRQKARLQDLLHELDLAFWPEQPHANPENTQKDAALAAARATIEELQRGLQAACASNSGSTGETSRGSLLNRVVIRPKEPVARWSYANLFARYFPGVTSVTIYEPYLSSDHQIQNLNDFLGMAASASSGHLTKAIVYTSETSRVQQKRLEQLASQAAASGRQFEFHYLPRLHNREIMLSNGVIIASDRGLDLYESPPIGLRRKAEGRLHRLCKHCVIDVYCREVVNTATSPSRAKMTSPEKGRRIPAAPKLGRTKTAKKTTDGSIRQLHFKQEGTLNETKQSTCDEDIDLPDSNYDRGAAEGRITARAKQQEAHILARERASMMTEHAAAVAREQYELSFEGGGVKNEVIRKAFQRLAIWDIEKQHLSGKRYFGDMQENGIISYCEVMKDYSCESRTIKPANPYVFRVRDEYHQLYINHYYDGEDYTSDDSDDYSSTESDGSK